MKNSGARMAWTIRVVCIVVTAWPIPMVAKHSAQPSTACATVQANRDEFI